MLKQRAEAAGAHYVDTYTPFEGHDACADAGTRWIEPFLADSDAAAVHPNERGERVMADAVVHTLTTSGWVEGRERGAAPVADAVR